MKGLEKILFGIKVFLSGRLPIEDADDKERPLREKEKRGRSPFPAINVEERIQKWAAVPKRFCGNFTFEDMVISTGIPKRKLLRYFKETIAKDFRTWKTDKRIDMAKNMLLENEDSSIAEIASRLGFEDKSNFHRQFKKRTGCTPSHFRNTGGLIYEKGC